METDTVLTAQPRPETGKGPAGRLRREGRVPAVFYGPGREARSIWVDLKEFNKVVFSGAETRSLFRLRLGDEEKTVMLKEHQIDPLKRVFIHADFYEVDVTRPIEIEVPLVLTGKAPGVERGGL
ncbi:MAG: 50S ribosomal protein L25, partial [Thermodesulfobacteriota bacterium]